MLGGQGDEWDAQNDMVSALVGSLLMVGVVALLQRTEARPRFHSVPVSLAGRDARASGSEGTGVGWGEEDAERNTFAHSNARDTRKHFLPIAVVCYVAFWIALAIHPLDRSDWLLENLLIFISVTVLALTYGKFEFSNFSYALILIFLAFHTIGAHYTYAKVPAGFWMQDWLHLNRNHYDRVIHFSFGFLLLYPMHEMLVRSAHARPEWAIWLSVAALAALNSFSKSFKPSSRELFDPISTPLISVRKVTFGTHRKTWQAAFVGAMLTAIVLIFASKQSTSRA
ncbi:MAG: hypothetical protein DMF27_13800 [Verrucomicrobia bacterium]|nr:MAG: hypothetical protein DMF27_13800 [Verrucomicrobiota bacterium]